MEISTPTAPTRSASTRGRRSSPAGGKGRGRLSPETVAQLSRWSCSGTWSQSLRWRGTHALSQLPADVEADELRDPSYQRADQARGLTDRKSTRLNSSHIPLSRMP